MFEKYLSNLSEGTDVRNTLIEIKKLLAEEDNADCLKNTTDFDVDVFIGFLNNEDPKIRKNAALILGMLKEQSVAEVLFNAYIKEQTLFVKSAYLTALSEYDITAYTDRLEECLDKLEKSEHSKDNIKHVAEEIKALKKLLPAKEHKRHVFRNPVKPVRTILTCRKENSELLAGKLSSYRHAADIKQIFCGVICTASDIKALSSIRIYRDILFPLNGMKPLEKNNLAEEIACGNLMPMLDLLHTENTSPYYFRITAKNMDAAMLAGKVQALSGGRLVNAPSDYEIEIRLIEGRDGSFLAMLKLHTLGDYRFAYRVDHIAASIHPVNAATVVELAKDYLKKDAQILDPFCGVGTMLVERNKAVPAKYIYGTDIYGKAIEGARINSERAGVSVNYINRDFFDFRHEYLFDEIITNMPVFETREENDKFYYNFFKKTEAILKKYGIMVLYSGEKNIIKKYLRLNDDFKLLREFVINEREEYFAFIISRN